MYSVHIEGFERGKKTRYLSYNVAHKLLLGYPVDILVAAVEVVHLQVEVDAEVSQV